jgi:hypothetical protein
MFSRRSLIALSAGTVLCGCATGYKNIGQEDRAMGEAVKYNTAVQTINPDPVYAEGGALPGDNGDRGAQTVKRYRTDQVNARHKAEASSAQSGGLSTTQGVGGGSGGGSTPR